MRNDRFDNFNSERDIPQRPGSFKLVPGDTLRSAKMGKLVH